MSDYLSFLRQKIKLASFDGFGLHRPGLRLQVLPLGVRQEFFREVAEREASMPSLFDALEAEAA